MTFMTNNEVSQFIICKLRIYDHDNVNSSLCSWFVALLSRNSTSWSRNRKETYENRFVTILLIFLHIRIFISDHVSWKIFILLFCFIVCLVPIAINDVTWCIFILIFSILYNSRYLYVFRSVFLQLAFLNIVRIFPCLRIDEPPEKLLKRLHPNHN